MELLVISHRYTKTISRRIFNYKKALQDLNFENYLKLPLTCDCSSSPSVYSPSGHVITGDLGIIQNEFLCKKVSHGSKFQKPQQLNWNLNFKIIMDAVEDYARVWVKRETDKEPELATLSDWVKCIQSLV